VDGAARALGGRGDSRRGTAAASPDGRSGDSVAARWAAERGHLWGTRASCAPPAAHTTSRRGRSRRSRRARSRRSTQTGHL